MCCNALCNALCHALRNASCNEPCNALCNAGFCLSSLTLRPSAFYGAAGLRTAAVRASIVRNVTLSLALGAAPQAPLTGGAAGGGERGACLRGSDGTPDGAHDMGGCQRRLCGITACNSRQ